MSATDILLSAAGGEIMRGESVFAIPGTYSWQVPLGVSKVSIVCIGGGAVGRDASNVIRGGAGGGLSYVNNITVTPGETLTVIVGNTNEVTGSKVSRGMTDLCHASGAERSSTTGGGPVVGVGGTGGAGTALSSNSGGASGAGAGGYSGVGGSARARSTNGTTNGLAGTGSSAGSGAVNQVSATSHITGQGGGVSLYGAGAAGAGGTTTGDYGGGGGSGGLKGAQIGAAAGQTLVGAQFGGGGVAMLDNINYPGGTGAARIIWPGNTRLFPTTDVGTP